MITARWEIITYKLPDGLLVHKTVAYIKDIVYVRSDMYTQNYLAQATSEDLLADHRLRLQFIMLEATRGRRDEA